MSEAASTDTAALFGEQDHWSVAPTQLAELSNELSEMRDRWLRAEATIANVRARAKRDVDDARQYGNQKFAVDVAEAAENMERGLHSFPAASSNEPEIVSRLRIGFTEIERSFIGLLAKNGISRTDPTGMAFDPKMHQAMAAEENGDHPSGTVLHAWTQVWTLNGRLLRPAMVVVAKAPAS